jgi:CubicO group peptidase (beta-lactamase class C family)
MSGGALNMAMCWCYEFSGQIGLAMTTLIFRPGTSQRYSNYRFGLLGHALERATGQPYEALRHEKLRKPLEMVDTKISLTAEDLQRFAALAMR